MQKWYLDIFYIAKMIHVLFLFIEYFSEFYIFTVQKWFESESKKSVFDLKTVFGETDMEP